MKKLTKTEIRGLIAKAQTKIRNLDSDRRAYFDANTLLDSHGLRSEYLDRIIDSLRATIEKHEKTIEELEASLENHNKGAVNA